MGVSSLDVETSLPQAALDVENCLKLMQRDLVILHDV